MFVVEQADNDCGSELIPVALFANARPEHLARALACPRENSGPLIDAYADGAKCAEDAERAEATPTFFRAVYRCEVPLTESVQNVGLAASVFADVSEVATKHEAFILWEDALICGCARRRHYADDARVVSVSGSTKPSSAIDRFGLRWSEGDAPTQTMSSRIHCWKPPSIRSIHSQ